MAQIKGGPHDGATTLNAIPGQFRLVLSLNPCCVNPDERRAASLYDWIDGRWVFERFTGPDEDWSELMFGKPRPPLPPRKLTLFERLFNCGDE